MAKYSFKSIERVIAKIEAKLAEGELVRDVCAEFGIRYPVFLAYCREVKNKIPNVYRTDLIATNVMSNGTVDMTPKFISSKPKRSEREKNYHVSDCGRKSVPDEENS